MHLPKIIPLLAGLLISSVAHAQSYSSLLAGDLSSGTGSATITFDQALVTMRVEVSFSGLTGTVDAADIHSATAAPGTGVAGTATNIAGFVGFPIGVTSGSYDHTFDMASSTSYSSSFITSNGGTTTSALASLIAAFDAGKAYLTIHTSAFPAGEIRGFPTATAIPEPSTYAGFAGLAALTAVVTLRRRRC